MPEICEGVTFDTVAREWRLKWATEGGDDKSPLVAVQKVMPPPVDHVAHVLREGLGLCGLLMPLHATSTVVQQE